MREYGQVVAVDGDRAQVKVVRGDKCGECQVCRAFGEGGGIMEARNRIGAAVGDLVEVEVSPKTVVGHSMLLFIVPLVFLMLGYVLGRALPWPATGGAEMRGILGAFLFLTLSFFLVRAYDRWYARRHEEPAQVVAFAMPVAQDPTLPS
ncbi:MAG: SoxR reducing system RseC family protein [candidate division KSB1 bacterium]|nr:SoxR reducing system RseC family protein [candidate division KSB1 bacterium]MDZ7293901.1 SoxR reducing system RseC family protein [candidate division KSB1 bacterium]MDZ7384699.1 SoxR reducing system RseC family protein [candidate division KSB1 bacterium]MDZ7392268.1 SoxR reducing system RseC family protein [candidate division KSB1 bacterium]MDZ7413067.1 SoxR reducing system RseC family protein [candidate division KSB1 bacterium]